MSKQKYQKDCPGCLPVMIDPITGKVYPDDSPIMRATMKVWNGLEQWQREAFHDFCCLNIHSNFNHAVMNDFKARLAKEEVKP